MLRLLLDEHVSPVVAVGLRKRDAKLSVFAMRDWEQGGFLGRDDADILQATVEQGLTLVTYDRRTIPPLLKSWAEQGLKHGGVVIVDDKTIWPTNVGGLVRALSALARESRLPN